MSLKEMADLMAFQVPTVYEYTEPPPPDPTIVLYGRILSALASLQSALGSLTIPAPVVQVSEPDYEGLVQALMQTRPEMLDYDKLVGLVRDAINIPAPVVNVDSSQFAESNGELKRVLEGLAFSLQGLGRMGSGGGSVSLQPGQTIGITGGVGTMVVTAPITGQGSWTSGSAAQITSTSYPVTNGVLVRALKANTNNVYTGASGITTSTGFELAPGESTSYTCANANLLYVIGTHSGDGVCFSVL